MNTRGSAHPATIVGTSSCFASLEVLRLSFKKQSGLRGECTRDQVEDRRGAADKGGGVAVLPDLNSVETPPKQE